MKSRFVKTIVVFLLGSILAGQGVFTSSAEPNAGTPDAKKSSCCCTGCDFKNCATPVCCVSKGDDRTPIPPAPARSTPRNDWQAIATPVVLLFAISLCSIDACVLPSDRHAPAAAVPIFQRDCAYLI